MVTAQNGKYSGPNSPEYRSAHVVYTKMFGGRLTESTPEISY